MCTVECPLWIYETNFEEIIRRPALSAERHATVMELLTSIWRSPLRAGPLPGTQNAYARVAARRMRAESGCTTTTVLFGLEDPLQHRDESLRTLVESYSASFGPQGWPRTRWFITEPCGALSELKLQSQRPGKVWFLQEFSITEASVHKSACV